jgi:hypothetical protein
MVGLPIGGLVSGLESPQADAITHSASRQGRAALDEVVFMEL